MEWLYLALALLLIAGTGVFVAAEFSLLTLDKHTVEEAVRNGEPGSKYLEKGLHHLSTQLSAAQVGITITTLLTGYLMQPSLGALLIPLVEQLGASETVSRAVSLVVALIVSTFLSMVVGELVPKNLAISAPMKAGSVAVPLQYMFSVVFRPVIALLNGTANKALVAMGIEPQEESSAGRSADELTSLVRHSADEGTMDVQTADLLARTLSISERTAEDVMTPRTRMATVERDTTAAEITELSRQTGYSRFPVVGDSRDDIVGVVHVKQAVAVPLANREDAFAAGLMTDVSEVPETMPVDHLLVVLRSRGNQMVLVIDEYGGTAGVATLEDVVEELVGEVVDEHDRLSVQVRPARDGTWLVPGSLRPDKVTEASGIEIPEDVDYETMAGFVMFALGKIPDVGDSVRVKDASLVVERMHGHRIERLRLVPDYLGGVA
ncbi:CBS domain containing-hemolysin-like protein [Brevibacterium paucivorans]|uniref:CBS domain containing-hemolysin-like protein n=1 Tax=Brevibacterium paucivorans TaxID=170994 RepID=A0ABS2SH47_9MICO|nr:hemolysin family protein [Brevibacterium paucivorans]MBM7815567.1 CBS domain containing-hemolysin-like protein [Brevibacterium paucivorans]